MMTQFLYVVVERKALVSKKKKFKKSTCLRNWALAWFISFSILSSTVKTSSSGSDISRTFSEPWKQGKNFKILNKKNY